MLNIWTVGNLKWNILFFLFDEFEQIILKSRLNSLLIVQVMTTRKPGADDEEEKGKERAAEFLAFVFKVMMSLPHSHSSFPLLSPSCLN